MKILESIISNVTVFTDRAQITRIAKVTLPQGENTVVFSDLPKRIDQNSIQVKGGGSAVLNDIKFKQVFSNEIKNEAVAELVKKIEELQKEVDILNENITIEQKELDFVEKIISKTTHIAEKETTNEELNPEKWIKMVDFYRQKNENITKKLRELNYQKRELKEKIKVHQKEMASLGNDKNKTTNQIEIVLNNSSDEELVFSLTYIVYGASWSPLYDIRVSSETKTVAIEYKAQISQNTGEAWENVKMAISTAQVNVSGTMPKLSPWRVNFFVPAPPAEASPKIYSKASLKKKSIKRSVDNFAMNLDDEVSLGAGRLEEKPMKKPKAEIKTGATSVLFEIPSRTTILNDNQPHKVNIIIEDLSAKFTYAAVPKLSQYAYLKAKITNTTEYPFLPGETNIFLDSSFVANSNLKLIAPSEEFETSLGIDEGVKIEHKLIKKYEKNTGLISKKSNLVFEYQTTVKNNKKHSHKIEIYNQLPISQHEDIKVDLLSPEYKQDTDSLKIDKEKKITWYFELEAGAKKTLDFIFAVESPKDSVLDGI